MIKNVYDYFEDLHKKDLPKNEHSFLMDNERITDIDNSGFVRTYGRPNLSIDGTPYHAKKMHEIHPMMELSTTIDSYKKTKDMADTLFNKGIPTFGAGAVASMAGLAVTDAIRKKYDENLKISSFPSSVLFSDFNNKK